MVPMIIIKNIIGLFKKYNRFVAVFIIAILTAISVLQYKSIQTKNAEIDRITNNYEYYSDQYNNTAEHAKVLQLTLDEFKASNDSLIQEIQTVQKKLKIKDKEVNTVQLTNTVVEHDTTVVVKDNDFDVVIKPNELTSIQITKQDTLLIHKIEIENAQTVFLINKKEYKRKYSNWFKRLLHLDFKKKTVYEYQIDNSNDLITVKDSRLIELN